VNRKSKPLLAMKYAIGEITFLGVRFGMSLRLGTSKPRTTAEGPGKVSHDVCNWRKLFSRPSHTGAHIVGREKERLLQGFPGRCGGTKIEVSHERFNWLTIRK